MQNTIAWVPLSPFVTFCIFFSNLPPPVPFSKKWQTMARRKEDFLLYMAAWRYHIISKAVRISHYLKGEKLHIYKQTYMYKQFYGSGNITISDIQLLRCVFLAVDCNIIRASWDIEEEKLSCTKNGPRKILTEWNCLISCTPSSFVTFCHFFVNPPSPNSEWRSFWMPSYLKSKVAWGQILVHVNARKCFR